MVTGVILAGGQSRRMGGQPKGLLTLSGETLITRLVRRMRPLCKEIIVVTHEGPLYQPHLSEDVRMVPDLTIQAGPLGGMEAALAQTNGSELWIVGCDMPYISADAARFMLQYMTGREELDAVLPSINGKLHPLHGIYRKRVEGTVQQLLKKRQLRVMGLFEHIRSAQIEEETFRQAGIDTNFVTNANTPDEWRHVQHTELAAKQQQEEA